MHRDYYTAAEAARALGISLDTLRRWDKSGKLRAQRDDANRRIVSVAEVERLRGTRSEHLSARNKLAGVVRSVEVDGLLAQVVIDVAGPTSFVAIVTRDAVSDLGLEPGDAASAVVKATSVMLER
mgnify:CR=1 FL=1|jgi:molybdopterin-binding protein